MDGEVASSASPYNTVPWRFRGDQTPTRKVLREMTVPSRMASRRLSMAHELLQIAVVMLVTLANPPTCR